MYVGPCMNAPGEPAEIVSATPTFGNDGPMVDVRFSADVLLDGLGAAFSASSGYVTSVERDGNDFSLVHVHVAGVASDSFNLSVDGARVKAAAKAYREGYSDVIVACGGTTEGHHISEAEVMQVFPVYHSGSLCQFRRKSALVSGMFGSS